MSLAPDPLVVAGVLACFLSVSWVFAMDIQNASRALWNASGHILDRVKHNVAPVRKSSDYFKENRGGYAEASSRPDEEDEGLPPDGGGSWSLLHRYNLPKAPSLGVDEGHFSEEEFLRRFGSGDKTAGPSLQSVDIGLCWLDKSSPSVHLDCPED